MGKLASIVLLLQSGIPIDITDNFKANDSLLHWACSFNNIDVAELLISEGGINVNIVNHDGQNSLFISCKNENIELVKMLLTEGCDSNHTDHQGVTPLDLLNKKERKSDSDKQIIQLLTSPPRVTKTLYNSYLVNLQIKTQSEMNNGHENRTKSTDNHTEHDPNCDVQTTHNNTDTRLMEVLPENDREYDFVDDDDDAAVGSDTAVPQLELVIYPPAKKQSSEGKVVPLILSSASTLIISITIASYPDNADVYPLLLSSNLIHVLDEFGFQTQVKRSTNWAKIKLIIDPNLCPGRHGMYFCAN